jgi:hypothetical protein
MDMIEDANQAQHGEIQSIKIESSENDDKRNNKQQLPFEPMKHAS